MPIVSQKSSVLLPLSSDKGVGARWFSQSRILSLQRTLAASPVNRIFLSSVSPIQIVPYPSDSPLCPTAPLA